MEEFMKPDQRGNQGRTFRTIHRNEFGATHIQEREGCMNVLMEAESHKFGKGQASFCKNQKVFKKNLHPEKKTILS